MSFSNHLPVVINRMTSTAQLGVLWLFVCSTLLLAQQLKSGLLPCICIDFAKHYSPDEQKQSWSGYEGGESCSAPDSNTVIRE